MNLFKLVKKFKNKNKFDKKMIDIIVSIDLSKFELSNNLLVIKFPTVRV